MSTLQETLTARGILDAATAAGWSEHAMHGRDGWLYPVLSTKLPGHSRWKAADGGGNGKAKYLWHPAKAEARPVYYFVNGIKAAVEADNGLLYWAGGEPDVVTFAEAGAHNAMCVFGEKNLPESLVDDFRALGVKRVIYPFDVDETGLAAAVLMRTRLLGTGIAFSAVALPGDEGSHYDINRLWIDCEFDAAVFWGRFLGLPEAELPALPEKIDWEREYTEWCEDVEREAVRRWDIQGREKAGEWARGKFSSPLRSDSDPSARWSYGQHGFKDFGTNEFHNTHAVAEYLGFEAWEARKRRLIDDAGGPMPLFDALSERADTMRARPKTDPKAKTGVRVVSRDQAISTVMDWLDGKKLPSAPVLSPYQAMHQLGGMAEMWERRKIVLVVGAAGMGKTAFLETGADALNRRGVSGIGWGPEWSPEDVQMKSIARYGGPSYSKQRKAHLWHMEAALGIPEDKRHGQPLTAEEHEKAYGILCKMLEWPGKMWYVDSGTATLPEVLTEVDELTQEKRGEGYAVDVLFIDYLQKLKMPQVEGQWNTLEEKADRIWQVCVELDMVGVIAAQVSKQDSRDLRKNKRLDHAAAQGLSDQRPNLYITLNPVFDADGNRLERGVISVVKNSSGVVPAEICVKTALYRHYWSDDVTKAEYDDDMTAAASTHASRTGGES